MGGTCAPGPNMDSFWQLVQTIMKVICIYFHHIAGRTGDGYELQFQVSDHMLCFAYRSVAGHYSTVVARY